MASFGVVDDNLEGRHMSHSPTRSGVFVALVSTLLIGTLANAAAATHIECGDIITADTTLDSDLLCEGDGLVIGAPGVTLDLGGHVVSGPGFGTGVVNTSGHDNVTVTNGTIHNFTRGVWMINVSNASVTKLHLAANSESGIEGRVTDDSVFANNTIVGSRRGILIWTGSDANTITRNQISERSGPPGTGAAIRVIDGSEMNWITKNIITDHDYGIDLGAADNNYVMRNSVSSNAFDGIFVSVSSDNTTVDQNSTDRNGRFGVNFLNNSGTVARTHGWFNGDLGIRAGSGVTDGGGNSAKHNGDPNECSAHISC